MTTSPVSGPERRSRVAIPAADEEGDRAVAHHCAFDLPSVDESGVWGRPVAGHTLELDSRVETHSPTSCLHWEFTAGARADLPAEQPEQTHASASAKRMSQTEAWAIDGGMTAAETRHRLRASM